MPTFHGLPWGQLIVVLGAPKTGKSTFAGSVAEVINPDKIALLCTKPNEANSFMYRRHGLSERAEIFMDSEWDPELGLYKADAWRRLNRRIKELTGDPQIEAVIIDSGTDAMDLLSHDILSNMKVAGETPGDTGDLKKAGAGDAPFAYYGKLKNSAQRFMNRLVECAMHPDAPKFVIVPWHTQTPTEEEQEGKGVMYEGRVLPMIEGRYRQKLAGDCDVVVYTDVRRLVEDRKPITKHMIQVAPSSDKHAAVRAMPMGSEQWLPNSFAALHKALTTTE